MMNAQYSGGFLNPKRCGQKIVKKVNNGYIVLPNVMEGGMTPLEDIFVFNTLQALSEYLGSEFPE